MQGRKNGTNKNIKKDTKQEIELEEVLADGRFDEEDEDSVTDDTLEFLCLDDETIETYRSEQKSTRAGSSKKALRYRDEDDDDEEDEDDIDDEEEYYEEDDEDDEYYEDEEEDDDEYYEDEDDDDEYEYDDERTGVIARFRDFLADMSTLDMVVAMFGILVLAGVIATSALFVNAKSVEKQVEAFASIGEEVEGISVIGEGGLLAVSESAKLAGMLETEEEEQENQQEEEAEKSDVIEVTLNLTSIQSDLKIKFVNKATGKLISGVPFEVEVKGDKTFDLKDDDKDGIIYQTGVAAGTYSVTAGPLSGGEYAKYKLPAAAVSVKVTDQIAYKKVDVADEIKDESEINVAAEEKVVENTVVESQLTDTVEWVESTKTPIDSDDNYEEIKKDDIPDPAKVSAVIGGFMKMASVSENTQSPEEKCSCRDSVKCTERSRKADCPVCQKDVSKCEGREAPKECSCTTHCTDGSRNESCPVCKEDPSKCKVAAPTCNCEIKCESGKPNRNCPVCKDDVSGCQGKAAAQTEYKVRITDCPSTLTVGASGRAKAETTPGGGKVKWSSSDTKVVEIDADSGKLTAKTAGTVEIVAKYEGTDASDQVTVKVENTKYTAIELSGEKTVKVGDKITIKGKTTPEGGAISWTSSDEKIAKIDKSDSASVTVKGIAAGAVKITAKCGDASKEWEVKVVKDLAGDNKTKLKDKNGNQIYIKKDGKYVEATYADYYTADKFYLAKSLYRYTGWQTIDGHVYFFDKDGNYVTGEQVIQGAKYNFGSDGKLSSGSGSMGIDVSKHNGSIDWNAVKNAGVSYAIIRCGYRGYSTGVLVEDPKFASNIKGAKAAGIKVGVYIYSQAVNEVEAVEEASMALNLVKGYGLEYPIFIDVEASGGRGDGIGSSARTAVCQAFCQTVQNSGYSAGVYSNKNWFSEQINTSSLTGYKIWLAQYAAAPTYTATRYDMWQYSSKGKVSGISGNVDMNICYLNY